MTIVHFPQYEHELFWKYYNRLHDFLAHCGYCLEKWEILNMVYEGVTCETRALLEHWDFCARNVDEAWELLEWLARDTYEFETCQFTSSTPSPCVPNYTPLACEICHCSDHDSVSCPYHISADGFARISSMIEAMNEQQVKLANRMREYDLSHKTNLRVNFSELDFKLCDDGGSSVALES